MLANDLARQRLSFLDSLRAIAILMVVYIHASIGASSSTQYMLVDFIDALIRFSVPLFVFISGFLSVNVGVKKILSRLPRIILPFLILSLMGQIIRGGLAVFSHPYELFWRVFFGDTFGIYYFVFIILYLYLLTPIINYFKKFIFIILPLCLSCSLIYLLISEYHLSDSIFFNNYEFIKRSPFIWLSFYLFGAFLRIYLKEILQKISKTSISIIFIFISIIYAMNYFLKFTPEQSVGGFIWFIYSFTAILFFVIYSSNWKRSVLMEHISGISYPIYLLHILPIQFFTLFVMPGYEPVEIFVRNNYLITVVFLYLLGLGASWFISGLVMRYLGKYAIIIGLKGRN